MASALLASATLLACQDGPNQTYTAPKGDAGFNDGRAPLPDGGILQVPGTATVSTAPYALPDGGPIGSGGTNANEICTQDQVNAKLKVLATAPILPPNGAATLNIAGLDDAGNVTWKGLTIEQAEQQLCQGTPQPDIFGNDLTNTNVFWDNGAVVVEYAISNHKVDYIGLGLFSAYRGTMTATSYDGTTTFVISADSTTVINETVTAANGSVTHPTVNLSWDAAAAGDPAAVAVFDQIYQAAIHTFLPGFARESAGVTCNQTGACVIGTFPGASAAYFFVPALGWAMWAGQPYTTPSVGNAINRIDVQFAQIVNYSNAQPVLKLDADGPTSLPQQLAQGTGNPCILSLGLDWNAFLNNCVLTAPGGPTSPANASELREIFSDSSHDEETYNLNIAGVDLSFANNHLGPTQTIVDPPLTGGCPGNPTDPACPQQGDYAFGFSVDQSTLSNIANDWIYDTNGNAITHDLHGAGALYDDYRTVTLATLENELCAGGSVSTATCTTWQGESAASELANCILPRDPVTGIIAAGVDPTTFAPSGCTGMETLLSADLTTPDDPVNIGPFVTKIAPSYTLGMKMGHQVGAWCTDAMSRQQIAAMSFIGVCPGGASLCAPSAAAAATYICPAGSCDPTQGACPTGAQTCAATAPGAGTALTVAQVDAIGTGAMPTVPTGKQLVLNVPQLCSSGNLIPQSHLQVLGTVTNGNASILPIDIQDNRFFFRNYGLAVIQTLEAFTETTPGPGTAIKMPVAQWGYPSANAAIPVDVNNLFFDSLGAGQFETFEYVDRRFVCHDGANQCAPPGSTGWTCPTSTCAVGSSSCSAGQSTCNAAETAGAPYDINFTADVKDGIMNDYNFNRYFYRGETALYRATVNADFSPAQQSDALFTNIFGSALIPAIGGLPPGTVDLLGYPINPTDYAAANSGPLSLSWGLDNPAYGPTSSALQIVQTFPFEQQALVAYPDPTSDAGTSQTLIPWVPNQPGSGFDEAQPNNSTLDYFVQTSSIDFTGVTTTALLDYNLVPSGGAGAPTFNALAVESQDFLGDVFLCSEAGANPPLLAVRMYTPTLAVLDWLNQNPQAYSDCGIVVRWSPYDNFINLIESTTYGVRLQVTQGGGLGRVVGATLYVPNQPVEE